MRLIVNCDLCLQHIKCHSLGANQPACTCSEFEQRPYRRPSFAIKFFSTKKFCLTCQDLLQIYFTAFVTPLSNFVDKVSKLEQMGLGAVLLASNCKSKKMQLIKSWNIDEHQNCNFHSGFSWGHWRHCECTWHSQGPLFYDPHQLLLAAP